MPRNDGRSRARDKFGKPGTSYPEGSLAHPTVIEERTDHQEVVPKAFLTAHDRTAGALLTEQDATKGDNMDKVVMEKYETLPSVEMTGMAMSAQADGAVVATSKQRMRADTGALTPDFKTISYVDTPLDNNRKERQTVVLPDAAFPILSGSYVDAASKIRVNYTKQIVAAGTAPASTYAEIKELDKWRSIQIVPTLDVASMPAANVFYGSMRHSWPDLTSAFKIRGVVSGSTLDLGFTYNLVKGYSGPCDAKFTETYTVGAPGSPPAIEIFDPQSPQFAFYGSSGGSARVWEFRVPQSLHAAWTPVIDGSGGGALVDGTVAATTPVTWPTGYIVVDFHSEKWRFGVYRNLKVEVKKPA